METPEPPEPRPPRIFISCVADDAELARELASALRSVIPSEWEIVNSTQITAALDLRELWPADVLIPLVSVPYLESGFPVQELGEYVLRPIAGWVMPVIASPCPWEGHPLLRHFQGYPRDGLPLREAPDLRVAIERAASELGGAIWSGGGPQFDRRIRLTELADYHVVGGANYVLGRTRSMARESQGPITSALILAGFVGITHQAPQGPQWAAEWLTGKLGGERGQELTTRILRDAINLSAPGTRHYAGAQDEVDADAVRVLESAREIARRTTASSLVHARHLFAALLTPPRGPQVPGAAMQLYRIGLDLVVLCEEFFEFVRGDGDNDDAWGALLLGEMHQPPVLAGFNADAGGGEDDYLDVRADVMAFAGLIAARTLTPPLSIGLFGEWGSGKTFFMRMLQREVARLSRKSRLAGQGSAGVMQCDLPYYKRIVQIEFNAWHYVEGNLWASLVQHIFDHLHLPDDAEPTAVQKLQKPVLERLKVETAAKAKAEQETREAETQKKAAESALNTARVNFEVQAAKLAAISGENFLADVPVDDVLAELGPGMKALGVDVLAKNAMELRTVLGEARALLTRGNAAVVPLLHGEERGRRWQNLMLVLLAGPLVALIVALVLGVLGQDRIAGIAAFTTGAAAILGKGTPWLRKQLEWVGDRVKEVEGAQRSLDERIARAQAQNARAVREAEEQLRLREADYVAAKRREEEAQRRVAEARARLEETSVTDLMASFIEDRANSSDYRRHLGVLALVRNDFELLSGLIEEENWRLAPPVPGEDVSRRSKPKFRSIAEEQDDEGARINRIVLYIDDLDRCPPAKVVEVLQAVHLLLAFPLFVVVVGVDARWVTRSLEARYRELLSTAERSSGRGSRRGRGRREASAEPLAPPSPELDQFEELFGKGATTHDYLEKIFQVPFWLQPMSDDGVRRMVDGLLRGSIAADGDAQGGERGAADHGEATGDASPPDRDGREAGGTRGRREREEERGDGGSAVAAPAGAELPDLSPESLEITAPELEFIHELAPLLGRSPRALKRFVNVYRILKAGLSPYQRRWFLRKGNALADFHAVLFLLAVDTGAPRVAPALFRALADRNGGPEPLTLTGVIGRLDRDLPGDGDWERVRAWLSPDPNSFRLPDDLARLPAWAKRVRRFSFHTARITVAATPVAEPAAASEAEDAPAE